MLLLPLLFLIYFRMGTKDKYYNKRCSYHSYNLRNYKGFKSSSQELGMKTNIHISFFISHYYSSFHPSVLNNSLPKPLSLSHPVISRELLRLSPFRYLCPIFHFQPSHHSQIYGSSLRIHD